MPYQRNLGFQATPTKSELLFSILKDYGWHSTAELSRRVSHAFAGPIYKLRQSGYTIEKQHHPTKDYQYQYRLADVP